MEELTDEQLNLLLTDFPTYYSYVCHYANLNEPSDLQEHISDIIGSAPSRFILEVCRGAGKSYISNVYVTWRILRDINEKILIVSATLDLAEKNASFVRKLFDVVPLLNHLSPSKNNDKKKRDSARGFDVFGCEISVSPTVAVAGITGQLTGKRATFILADDIEIPNNSATETMRALLKERIGEFSDLLIPDKPSAVLCLGTPQSMETVYNKIDGFETCIIPAEVPEDPMIYNGKLDDWVLLQGPSGTPTDKIRFTLEVLLTRKAEKGMASYKLQYMLDTSLADKEKYPLKLKDLICMPCDSLQAPYTLSYAGSNEYKLTEFANIGFTGDSFVRPMRVNERYTDYDTVIMSIDPAGQGTDEATYAILGALNGYIHIIDVGGSFDGFSDKNLLALVNKAKEYSVNAIILEKNWGGGMFTRLLEAFVSKIYPCTLYDVQSKGQKEVRIINAIEPLSTNHKLVINYSLIERDLQEALRDPMRMQYSFIYQYTHLTRDKKSLKHDDRLDAVAIGIEYLKEMMGVDAEELLKALEEEEMQKFLDERIYGTRNSTQNNNIIRR